MKKISLSRAFVYNPDIYILENPFGILDKASAFVV
jgi:ABC-type multidrug transport system ATPase subunit